MLLLSSSLFSSFPIAAHAQSTGAVAAELDKPFELKIGQQAAIDSENIVIGFLNVAEDSRCPSDVVCIWQGQASIRISAEVNGTDSGQFVLTIGANEKSATIAGGQYSVRMVSLEPYPVSTENMHGDYIATLVVSKTATATATNSAGVFVKAATASDVDDNNGNQANVAAVSGWDLQKGRGALVFLTRGQAGVTTMAVARFTPAEAQCGNSNATECIDGQVTNSRGGGIKGDVLHFEVLPGNRLYLAAGGSEYTLDIRQIKTKPMPEPRTIVTLSEGQRDGPLLVQEVGDGYVKGLKYVEYPLVRPNGFPVTLHVGDTASNGCTVMLTLLETHQHAAVFSKTTDYHRACPL